MLLERSVPNIALDFAVSECPCCGSKISPIYLTHHVIHFEDFSTYYVICQCPNKACNEIFFAKYTGETVPFDYGPNGNVEYDFVVQKTDIYPYSADGIYFDKEIYDLSSDFIEIYKQSVIAEKIGLSKLCGSGYRLALEILIKDFASYLNPENEQEIKRDTKVSNVIANRIPDDPILIDIKDIAKRTWWLGCDSTHYEKNYTSLDINDLKTCLNLTATSIAHYIKRQNYVNTIGKPKP